MGPCPNANHDDVTIEDNIASMEQSRIDIESTLQKQKEIASLCEEHTSSTQSYEVSLRDSIGSLERVHAALQLQEQELIAVLASLDNHLSFASSFLWRINCGFCSFFCGQRKNNSNTKNEKMTDDYL